MQTVKMITAVLALALVTAAGCGDDDEQTTLTNAVVTGELDGPETAVKTFYEALRAGEEAAACDLVAPRGQRKLLQLSGLECVALYERNATVAPVEELLVDNVENIGRGSTGFVRVRVTLSGGDGPPATAVILVDKIRGEWLLDPSNYL